jgi:hypothetical protein
VRFHFLDRQLNQAPVSVWSTMNHAVFRGSCSAPRIAEPADWLSEPWKARRCVMLRHSTAPREGSLIDHENDFQVWCHPLFGKHC